MKKIIILYFLIQPFTICFAQIQKMEIEKGKLQFDTTFFRLKGSSEVVEDNFFGKTLQLSDTTTILMDSLSTHGFGFSCWVNFSDTSDQQIFSHSFYSDTTERYFARLKLHKGYFKLYRQNIQAEPKLSKVANKKITPGYWYNLHYIYHENQFILKVLSSGFKFDANFPLKQADTQKIQIGDASSGKSSLLNLHALTLYPYLQELDASLRKQYDAIESALYGYHRSLIGVYGIGKKLAVVDSIVINATGFFMEIWDYDELDGDVILIEAADSVRLFRKGLAQENRDTITIKSKEEHYTYKINIPKASAGSLTFKALNMGYIDEFNTATMRIYTDQEVWDTIHINTDLKKDVQIKFSYNPKAKPPTDPAPEKNLQKPASPKVRIALPRLSSQAQKIVLRLKDHFVKDKDALFIQLNEQTPRNRMLEKKFSSMEWILNKKDNQLKIRALETKLLSCTAKIEFFEKGLDNKLIKIFEQKLNIKKEEEYVVPISFEPLKHPKHLLLVKDSSLRLSISDYQTEDGDSIQVLVDQKLLEELPLQSKKKTIEVNLNNKKSKTLGFTPTSMGEDDTQTTLCLVEVQDSKGTPLADYLIPLQRLDSLGEIEFVYWEEK